MSKPIEALVLNNPEGGEHIQMSIADYQKAIIKELGIKTQSYEEDGEQRPVTPEVAFKHIFNNVSKGNEVDEKIKELFPDLVDRVTADVKQTIENTTEKKESAEEKKKRKEDEKAEQEAKDKAAAEQLAKVQGEVAVTIEAGFTQADSEFKAQLETIRASLPEGVKVVSDRGGFGLEIGDDVSKETLGTSLGYLVGQSRNSEALSNQLQFWVGDIVNALKKKGVYPTAKEAGAAVMQLLGDSKSFSESAVSYYSKMAERTPVGLRNPHADPTAYLAVANMKLPTKGKDGNEKETDAEFTARKDKFDKAREEIQTKIASGEYKKRKDVLEPVENALIAAGLKKKTNPDDIVPITPLLKQFFHAYIGLEHLVGAHGEGKEDVAVYADGDKKYELTREQLQEMMDEAVAKLGGIWYVDKKEKITLRDYSRGTITKTVKAVKAKGKDGAVAEDQETQVPVYPGVWFELPKEEEPAATEPAAEEKKEETANA